MTSGNPATRCQSAALTPAASTRTSASPAPTAGAFTSSRRSTSVGGPNLSWTIAFMPGLLGSQVLGGNGGARRAVAG